MRTTITIPDQLISDAKRLSGKSRLSDAVSTALQDYVGMKKRLEFLDYLFDHPVPHNWKKIKAARKGRKGRRWSA